MRARCLQFIFLLLASAYSLAAAPSELVVGRTYSFTFQDVDGDTLSTNDGHVTILAAVTREGESKARGTADRVPDRYIGDPRFRYITLVNFQGKLASPFHGVTRAVIRTRLAAEARALASQYQTQKIPRDPRDDLFVVADFDGSAATQLGLGPADSAGIFVFDRRGKLVARWNDVPPGNSLEEAIIAADR